MRDTNLETRRRFVIRLRGAIRKVGSGFATPLLTACLILGAPPEAHAQDAHYWTTQYGNRSRLLAGAVIGSVDDVSSVFYNPGALALLETAELLLGGNVFEYTNLGYEGLVISDVDLSSNRFKSLPAMIAGEFPFKFLGKNRLAYSYLVRADFDFRIRERGVLVGEDIGLPALEDVAGDVRMDQDLTESWGGLTWARMLGPWGFGVSQFIAVRSQRTELQTLTQARSIENEELVALQNRDFRYTAWRILWKLGIGRIIDRWQFGVNVTSPSLSLGGSGDVGYDSTFVVEENDPSVSGGIVTTTQEDLPARYKTPLSVGGGGAYSFGEGRRVHFAAEWFAEVQEYDVIDSEPFVSPESGDTLSFDISQKLDGVFNAGVGIEYTFSDLLGGYGGFRTDFSARPTEVEGSDFTSTVSRWDIYHVSLGSTFTVERSDFTLGVVFSFGASEPFDPLFLLPGAPPPTDEDRMATADFTRITVILGFGLDL
jgi:hypothetical protein